MTEDMNYYFITGVSRGIGKALVEKLLKNENNYIIGLGRTSTIKHERFEFIEINLSNLELVKNHQFIQIIDAKSITLINNSGVLGYVDVVGNIENQSIIDTFNVNTIAPAILMNNFVNSYQNFKGKKMVLNVSSGAGRRAIDSWSSYCASKSALDMFTLVANQEQNNKYPGNGVKFISIAPGIVDTKMQDEIRELDESRFKDVNRFIGYKNESQLSDPGEVADKLVQLMENDHNYKETLLDIRDLNL
ncbi:MAG: SDR family NAD(P)-dependent oxidoreductase [Chloroflexia bacterium]|nr:SDR family NAD(P)-dependent oxidoreductase [Chloroflexia bacterium]